MFKRLRGIIRGTAAAQQTPPPPPDPVQLMHDDLVRVGFTQEDQDGVRCFTRAAGGRLLIVMNRDGDGLPAPDDWSVGLYDTTNPEWVNNPEGAVILYGRHDLPASFVIMMTAALAHLPRGA